MRAILSDLRLALVTVLLGVLVAAATVTAPATTSPFTVKAERTDVLDHDLFSATNLDDEVLKHPDNSDLAEALAHKHDALRMLERLKAK